MPELVFNPKPLAHAHPGAVGLHTAALAAVVATDGDVRRELLNGIVLTGGGSALPGLSERLARELSDVRLLQSVGVPGGRARLLMASASERQHGAWIGGSILASLGTFPDLWFSREEYKEHGAKMCHRKLI